MTEQINLVEIVGYEFYQVTFAAAICILPYMLWHYTILGITGWTLYKTALFLWDKFITGTIDSQGRAVFITGCDTGFGHAFAKHFDELGFTVFAGCLDEKSAGARRLRSDCSKRLHVVPLDVTKDKHVANAFAYVKKNKPKKGLWGIINNAGMNMHGEIEMSHVSYFQTGINVNMYGAIRVIRAFLPMIRQFKGRILNITSVHGLTGIPNQSNYEVAKHGLETLSDSLRLEMVKFGVKVSIVEPGMYGNLTSINSELLNNRERAGIDDLWNKAPDELKKTYTKQYLQTWLTKPSVPGTGRGNLNPVVEAVEHAICNDNPRTRYMVHGYGNVLGYFDQYAILAMCYRQLPTWLIDRYVIAWTGCSKFKK